MTPVSRTAQFAKVHKTLKKHYKPVSPRADRSVLEHLMFACCLEDAGYDAAEEAFAALEHTFFDWNEVRVTSLSELSEVMTRLPDPRAAGNRIKRILHSIFEAAYSFDLEDTRKKNLGPTVKWLEKLDGATRFIVAYVVQSALGGHQVPIDAGTMSVLRILDLVTDKDAAAGVVPGLERAVSKSKGIEFGSLLHQLGAEFTANPYSPAVRDILLQIEPTAKERFPQRRLAREVRQEEAAEAGKTSPAAKPALKAPTPPLGSRKKAGRKAEGPAPAEATAPSAIPAAGTGKTPPGSRRGPAAAETPADDAAKKPSSEGLSKRKPR
jgi:endonuclease-3